MRLPVSVDLGGFIALLRRLQVPHRVTEVAGEQVLWVGAEPIAERYASCMRSTRRVMAWSWWPPRR